MIDKETYFLKKLKSQFLKIFLLAQKSEESAIRQLKTGSDLSVSEMHTLVAIGRQSPKPMSEVASELMISVSTLSIAISKLESRGYVRRIKSEEDRRVVRVTLSAKGRHALDEHERFYFDLISAYMKDMTEEEKKEAVYTLDHVQRLLTSQLESSGEGR